MSHHSETRRLLILGGTSEARDLARALGERTANGDRRWSVISSLAGRTSAPEPIAGDVRSGGFGGASGLADYIATERIDAIVDATHPFAEAISRQAAEAASATGAKYHRLVRPPWTPEPGDAWSPATTVEEAAGQLPAGAAVFLTIGRQQLAPFVTRRDIRLVARMIEPPDPPLPDSVEVILARPPFTIEAERRLLADRRIDVVVTKNAGGELVRAKLVAARALGLPVIMIERPADQLPADATTVAGILALLDHHDV